MITFKGKKYETLASCYRDHQDIARVTCATFSARVRRGFTVYKALTTPKLQTLLTRLGPHVVEGKEFISLPAIARAYGMKDNAVYKRYSRGCRGDDLVPLKKRKGYTPPSDKNP